MVTVPHRALSGDLLDRAGIARGEHDTPRRLLGPHAATLDDVPGVVVRAYHPEAESVELQLGDGRAVPMTPIESGFFAAWLPNIRCEGLDYRFLFHFAGGQSWERHDPYRFPQTVSDQDLYLFAEGTHLRLWECLGARPRRLEGVDGWAFSVWAPNARRVSLVGDFCTWDGRLLPMQRLGPSGIFDLFLPGLEDGARYKFEILGADGALHLKADPMARAAESPPATASRLPRSRHVWTDEDWMRERATRDVRRSPLATYEVHLGSWRRGAGGTVLGYRDLARGLVEHVRTLGLDSIQLLPIAEHPFDGSWGYQVTGYYAPTARFGEPDDLRFFVDHCHRHGVAVILDWVPGHFVKDAHGLGRFDGSALYEHADPRQGVHPDWGTYIFNFGRHEVQSFLVSNALYWLESFHIDGLRIDAVASMLYLDYSRAEGEWIPNRHGGNENLEAVGFLRRLNRSVHERVPGAFTVAEESTAWPGVTRSPDEDGLGFDLKWNMGWMHDTLGYFSTDPLFRSGCQDQLTFAMLYEWSECFVNPLSHDEVVHGKGSLVSKMAGDPWQRLANLRVLLTYQFTRPGKKLLFMGSELASPSEWDHTSCLDWELADDPGQAGLGRLVAALGRLYRQHPCLWRSDPDPRCFEWIACWDHERSVLAYERRDPEGGAEPLAVVLNLTPVPRDGYRLGAPRAGEWRVLLSTDAPRFGGGGYPVPERFATADEAMDAHPQSWELTLPPLAALVLAPPRREPGAKT